MAFLWSRPKPATYTVAPGSGKKFSVRSEGTEFVNFTAAEIIEILAAMQSSDAVSTTFGREGV